MLHFTKWYKNTNFVKFLHNCINIQSKKLKRFLKSTSLRNALLRSWYLKMPIFWLIPEIQDLEPQMTCQLIISFIINIT